MVINDPEPEATAAPGQYKLVTVLYDFHYRRNCKCCHDQKAPFYIRSSPRQLLVCLESLFKLYLILQYDMSAVTRDQLVASAL
jgi:hypothetical protein